MPAKRYTSDVIESDGQVLQILPPDMSASSGGNLATGATTARVDLNGAMVVRVALDQDAYLNFGDNTVDAAAGDVLHAAGVELYAVPSGATHMAYIQSSAAGTMNWRKMGI